MNNSDKLFVGHAITQLNQKNIEVIFQNKDLVYQAVEKISCAGYFDCANKQIVIATKTASRNWLPIFLHEYCHFLQWKTKSPCYVNLLKNKSIQNHFWYWLQGHEVELKSKVTESARAIQAMEHECDLIALEQLDSNKLSIMKDDYIRFANVELMFYNLALKYRQWYHIHPYYVNEILNVVPNTILDDLTRNPPEFNRLVLKHCRLA